MRQWELDNGSLRADHSMFFGNTRGHTVPCHDFPTPKAYIPYAEPFIILT